MLKDVIKKERFGDIDLSDDFFSSLKDDYPGFERWFKLKEDNSAYVFREAGKVQGFLYLKDENEEDNNIIPKFEKERRLKIGTFKINAHGTVLGQRFLSIALRMFIEEDFPMVYVTVFEKQKRLVALFEKFGFKKWGTKSNGELVYFKDLEIQEDLFKDFPRFEEKGKEKYLLGILPSFHTKLFPESKLNTEKDHQIEDLSFTNTLEKVYLTKMGGIPILKKGDLLMIYRTAAGGGNAEWTSVGTSICTVVEYKNINEFSDCASFVKYCGKGSIFSESQLKDFWRNKNYPHIVKMLYNAPLQKRIVRHDLCEKVGMARDNYFGFCGILDEEFQKILELGEVNEGYVVN
ncbi:hypothetical protein [Listeria booriae]|uniref:hypothetical protein n=1 Tax=Listeria booriae TaxID=1552123 RepID=UPI0016255932|nr:hypothetical protein [Listeria booriae]MBC2259623.1 hypothetical protein [Listeria booriae]